MKDLRIIWMGPESNDRCLYKRQRRDTARERKARWRQVEFGPRGHRLRNTGASRSSEW